MRYATKHTHYQQDGFQQTSGLNEDSPRGKVHNRDDNMSANALFAATVPSYVRSAMGLPTSTTPMPPWAL